MARARGANAVMALAFEPDYGVTPVSGFIQEPFVSSNLGEEQPLEASNVLGFGRDPQDPILGAVDNVGDIVVPMCARNIGDWLKLMFGAPTTAEGLAATGAITFTAQPDAASTITVAGQAFTFVDGVAGANEISIGTRLSVTIANAVRALNASAVAGVAAATYRAGRVGNIEITHDALGTVGNAFTLAAAAGSNATVSDDTLAGGAANGGYRHTFVTGQPVLPSASIEIGNPEVPNHRMNYGVKGNSLAVTLARSGNLDVTINVIAQGEAPSTDASAAGSPTSRDLLRFSHFSGGILREGVPIADLVGGSITLANGLDAIPAIRGDGRISGADEGMVAVTGANSIRFSTREYQEQAEDGEAVSQEYSWHIPSQPWSLRILVHRVFLPKAKTPITGPAGVQADYNWQAAENRTLGRTATITLVNDVASY